MRSTRAIARISVVVCLLTGLATTVFLDRPRAQGGAIDPKLYQSLQWRNIGPDRGGRSIAASGVRGRRLDGYFGAVGGGLWKTVDGGETWKPVTDGQIESSSVGAVAVSESNPDVVYIGMGESHIRGNIMQGDGIYKSSDAGKTWSNVGLQDAGFTISRIRIHPTNPDIVYVAVFGNVVAPSPERGVYRRVTAARPGSACCSATTSRPASKCDRHEQPERAVRLVVGGLSAVVADVERRPRHRAVQVHRRRRHVERVHARRGAAGTGALGKIGIAVSRVDSNRLWVLLEHENGGLFMSDDAGATWKLVNDDRNIRQRAFYYSRVYADPKQKDTVWMLNVNMYRSTDAGKTLQNVRAPHGDYHDLWIDPDDSAHLVNANDGGGTVS